MAHFGDSGCFYFGIDVSLSAWVPFRRSDRRNISDLFMHRMVYKTSSSAQKDCFQHCRRNYSDCCCGSGCKRRKSYGNCWFLETYTTFISCFSDAVGILHSIYFRWCYLDVFVLLLRFTGCLYKIETRHLAKKRLFCRVSFFCLSLYNFLAFIL